MALIKQNDIDTANTEFHTEGVDGVELATAIKWGARSIAAFQRRDAVMGQAYMDEALEHASKVMDYGQTVKIIQEEIEKYD